MTDQPTDTAGNAAPTTGQAAGGTGGQPDFKSLYESAITSAKDYETRFKGMQTKYQQEQAKWQQDTLKLTSLEEQLKGTQAQVELFTKEKTTLAEEKETIAADLEIANAGLDRLKIITGEFPHLAEFEGMLADGTGEAFRAICKAFDEKLQARGKALVQEEKKDNMQRPPASGSPSSKEAMTAEMITAMANGDLATYDKLYSQLLSS